MLERAQVYQADPLWFNTHPRRRHRVRPVSLAEILDGVPPAPEGCTRIAAVRRVAADTLMTIYAIDCAATDYANLDERSAYEFFEQALSAAPSHLEKQLRADAERGWS